MRTGTVMARTKKREKTGVPLQESEAAREQSTDTATAPQSAGDTTAAVPDRERIAMRAYELYLSRGGSAGGEMEDWLKAEQELNSPLDRRNRK